MSSQFVEVIKPDFDSSALPFYTFKWHRELVILACFHRTGIVGSGIGLFCMTLEKEPLVSALLKGVKTSSSFLEQILFPLSLLV